MVLADFSFLPIGLSLLALIQPDSGFTRLAISSKSQNTCARCVIRVMTMTPSVQVKIFVQMTTGLLVGALIGAMLIR